MTVGSEVLALTTPDQLFDLLDPDVMWYSVDVNSDYTCNGKDDAVACIERGLARGSGGRFQLLGEGDDFVVVHHVPDPPESARQLCLLLRFREGLIVEMRDFVNADAALRYAGIA